MSPDPKLVEQLIAEEGTGPIKGYRLCAYRDSRGYWTLGHGRMVDARLGGGVTAEEALYLLRNDISRTQASLDKVLPWWRDLDDVRRRVMVQMAFQMGLGSHAKRTGLLGFSNTLAAIREQRWEDAGAGMLASEWASQTPERAWRLAHRMRDGSE